MKLLGKLETDGTYDQPAQVARIVSHGQSCSESIDLSSATDRFPMELQKILMAEIVGQSIADA
jgi:hypothetical protein